MIKGWKKLTKAEKSHLVEMDIWRSNAVFQLNIDTHAEWDRDRRAQFPKTGCTVTCQMCKDIANKCGFAPKGGW